MAKPLETVLIALEQLRAAGPGPAAEEQLEGLLETATSHGVVRVVALIVEWSAEALVPALRAGLDRFYVDPLKTDKGCGAKEAIYRALVLFQAGTPDAYRRGLWYRQPEPVWGGTADTAAGVRGLCAQGLVQTEAPDVALVAVAPLLADPEMVTRLGVIEALALLGGAGADAVLRLKAQVGDAEEHVLEACLGAVLATSDTAFPFLERFLDEAGSAAAAAYALGASRSPLAVPILAAWLARTRTPDRRRVALYALAQLRLAEADTVLFGVIREGSQGAATQAVEALSVHAAYHEDLHERILDSLAADPALRVVYERARARHRES